MISEDFANQQLARFAMHKGFELLWKEQNTALLNDYLWAVQTADTEDICLRVISDIISGPIRDMPKAAYIRTAMNEENDRVLRETEGDPTTQQIAQWRREAELEEQEWERAAIRGEIAPALPEPATDPTGPEKILEAILVKYRAGAWRLDPDGARHAALLQMAINYEKGKNRPLASIWFAEDPKDAQGKPSKRSGIIKRFESPKPEKMPQHLWDELCALQAKFKRERGKK